MLLPPRAGFDLFLPKIHGDIIHWEAESLVGLTRVKERWILSGLDFADNRPVKETVKGLGMEKVTVRVRHPGMASSSK